MARAPVSIETVSPSRCILNVESVGLTPDQFFDICGDNPELRLELTARKEIIIMPPYGSKGGLQNFKIIQQLGTWADADGTGYGFSTDAGFTLPNGAVRGPDAAWVRREKWDRLSREEQDKFCRLCPDFVVELRSPSDSLRELQEKMEEYIANGVELGWLIDSFERTVHVYRSGIEPQIFQEPATISGDPVLRGFTLVLTGIWE